MRFFLDACVPEPAARMLEVFDPSNEVRHLTVLFDQDTPDPDWLKQVAAMKPKPFVVTGDGRALKIPKAREILISQKMTVFTMAKQWPNAKWADYAWRIVRVWPHIVENAKLIRQPTIFQVSFNAQKVERMKHTAEL